MKINSVHLRNFRSLARADLVNCGALNILIGKNNSGKSSVLSALDLFFSHLSRVKPADEWRSKSRAEDEFTLRQTDKIVQIGLEFTFDKNINAALRARLRAEITGMEVPIEQIADAGYLSIILSAGLSGEKPIIFLSDLSLGKMQFNDIGLSTTSTKLIHINLDNAKKLESIESATKSIRNKISALERFLERDTPAWEYLKRDSSSFRGYFSSDLDRDLQSKIESYISQSDTKADFVSHMKNLGSQFEQQLVEMEDAEIDGQIHTFAGSARKIPKYVKWIMEEIGNTKVLHLKEIRSPVGSDEAAELLTLKIKRGGTERLETLRKTVKSLLSVDVDAFEAEQTDDLPRKRRTGSRYAEMDIDDFLVEANGAGIREALRIILDIELKQPTLTLIEEPEVHLHPGLERVLHSYLVGKSRSEQIFIATHSSHFIDVSARQSVYLLTRDGSKTTSVQNIVS